MSIKLVNNTVDAILMASGFSKRFGDKNKLLHPINGVPLARRTLQLACGSGLFGRVLFVWADEAVGRLAEGLPAVPIHNTCPQHGQRESVRLGVLASNAGYYMFFPCDQPFLDLATVRAVYDARRPGCIVVPSHNGRPGNPTLFSNAFGRQLAALAPGQKAREVKKAHPGAVIDLPLASAAPLLDIDAPEDLLRLDTLP